MKAVIKRLLVILALVIVPMVSMPVYAGTTEPGSGGGSQPAPLIPGTCPGGNFFSFPTWYKYLPGKTDSSGVCSPQLNGINDIWKIVAAVIEILLHVAAIVAVVMVIYGAVRYISSQGEPDKTTQARSTIIDALIGLMLAVMAAAFINFIATKIT